MFVAIAQISHFWRVSLHLNHRYQSMKV